MISTYLNGRLGNNLFQYVFCRISAIKNNCNFFVPKNREESISFYGDCMIKTKSSLEMPCDSNPHYWTGEKLFDIDFGVNDGFINKSVDDISVEGVADGSLLVGFYQRESHMLDFRGEIINNWLKFKDSIIEEGNHLLNLYDPNNYCYIHFRGTDYKGIPQFYLPKSYYFDAIEKIKEVNENIKFLVITDDVEESKKIFDGFEVISNTTEMDFYLLSQSKFSIIPNSSFSWWSRWLSKNNEMTIAPNRWFNYNSNENTFSPPGINTSFFTYI